MLKQILAIVIGFILWSICWLAYNILLRKAALLPADPSQQIGGITGLLALLFGSFVISIVSGYLAAWISPTPSNLVVLILGLLLLGTGIFFQMQYWKLMPIWYHLSFLALLIPFCFLGSWLRRATAE